jgi:3-hydroxyethyl bacteriochlorophyllide a dehydrogenase
MDATAVVLEQPQALCLRRLELCDPQETDIVVDVDWSGISTGTERLLWSGRMPPFPGLGYPLVPGYESVGHVVAAGRESGLAEGATVFVPGAACYKEARGLFGGTASRLIVPARRAIPITDSLGDEAVLMALAATARHAIAGGARAPDLIVGHGVLGRLLARITVALGEPAPTVWEIDAARRGGAADYSVIDPEDDPRRDYLAIYDASGANGLLDRLIARLAFGGEVVLAGFYEEPLSFVFPPAFMKEARIRIATEFKPADLVATSALIDSGALSLGGLITHHRTPDQAEEAYRTAFTDPTCLKMVLDWRGVQ